MKITFLGSGDAFGSGGRLQTCILVETDQSHFLMDCGASSLTAMRKYDANPNDITTILLTHLHGDHFGGIPFFILDAQMISKRTAPLTIAGPEGTKQRVTELMEVMFPGSSKIEQKFAIDIIEIAVGQPMKINGLRVTSFLVNHPSGAPSTALRVEASDKIVAFSGDTAWCDNLVAVAQGADLFITESYFFDKKVKNHLDYQTLSEHLPALQVKKLVLTHMGPNMLANLAGISCDYADDGKVFEI
ncbi:MAG: MBL fold metallo-hydrolase [Negativicutes bacterium]|nr:MBL fold metallo-hydrolase [Negativicutes bacterium]